MGRGKHTESQMIEALKQVEGGRSVEEVGRHYGVSKHTIYGWKAKYGGMDVSEAQEVKQLRDENARLKKLVADLSLDKDMLQSVIRKTRWARRETGGSAAAESGVCDQRAACLRAHEYSAIELPVPEYKR
jgi:putative transposase